MSNTIMLRTTMEKPHLSVKGQTLAAIVAIACAVAVPQIFHVFGAVFGMGTALGESFLPMHLPILLVGFLAGPYAGAVAGMFGPLVSFAISGMPVIAMLPFMMLELCVYGLSAGLFINLKVPVVIKVLLAQVAGRAIKSVAILAAVYGLGSESITVASIWISIRAGILGIVLQLVLIPVIIYYVERIKHEE